MSLRKSTIHQSFFYFLISLLVIFNGGNNNLIAQLNFILVSIFFLNCLKDLNYKANIKKLYIDNKQIIILYLFFLLYLFFQIIPLPIDFLKFFSPTKYNLLINLNFEKNFSSISFDIGKSFFNILNYCSIILYVIIFKSVFYRERDKKNFYLFLNFISFIASIVAVYFYLIGNPNFLFISNINYQNSSTGFFINRTVFACFLNLGFLAGIEYLKYIDLNTKRKDYFFNKIYLRLFLLFITIGIITSFSRLGNFLFLLLIIFYLFDFYKKKNHKNRFIFYSLIAIILFDILILGFYFGGDQLIDRFMFLKSELLIYTNDNNQNLTLARGGLAKFSILQISNFLLFGYGVGNFEIIFKIFFNELDNTFANHAHFDLGEFIGELGLLGAFFLFVLIFKIFKKIQFKSVKNIYLLVLIFLILAFDFSLHVPIIQILIVLLFSLNIKKLFS